MASVPHGALKSPGGRREHSASFGQWDSAAYLATYYSQVQPDERHTLRFLAQEARQLTPGSSVLEFGIGPTLHHVLPLAPYAREIHVADLLPANLEAVRQWCVDDPGAFDWRAFTREVLICEGARDPSTDDIDARESLVRERLTCRLLGDAHLRHPLGDAYSHRYDCVVSCYCADSATTNKHDWFRCLHNITSLLAPGGLFVVAALRNCSFYRVGDVQFPSPAIDEHDLQRALAMLGLDMGSVVLQVCDVPEQDRCGFQSIMLASGRLR